MAFFFGNFSQMVLSEHSTEPLSEVVGDVAPCASCFRGKPKWGVVGTAILPLRIVERVEAGEKVPGQWLGGRGDILLFS